MRSKQSFYRVRSLRISKSIAIIIILLIVATLFTSLKMILQDKTLSYIPASSQIISPTPNIQDKGSYKIYVNSTYHYSVQFPSNFETTEEEAPFSILFSPKNDAVGPGFPKFYVSVIPNGQNNNSSIYNRESKNTIDKFFTSAEGTTIATHTNSVDAAYFTFTKLPNSTLDQQPAVVVENDKVWEGGNGLKDRRIFVKKDGNTYMVGTYYQSNSDLETFNIFLSNFTFTN